MPGFRGRFVSDLLGIFSCSVVFAGIIYGAGKMAGSDELAARLAMVYALPFAHVASVYALRYTGKLFGKDYNGTSFHGEVE